MANKPKWLGLFSRKKENLHSLSPSIAVFSNGDHFLYDLQNAYHHLSAERKYALISRLVIAIAENKTDNKELILNVFLTDEHGEINNTSKATLACAYSAKDKTWYFAGDKQFADSKKQVLDAAWSKTHPQEMQSLLQSASERFMKYPLFTNRQYTASTRVEWVSGLHNNEISLQSYTRSQPPTPPFIGFR
jgi:hypothetical protein